MYTVIYEKQFYNDFNYWKRLVPELVDEIKAVVEEMIENGQIPDEYNPHVLTNHNLNYRGSMEFHLLDGKVGLLVIYYPNQKKRSFRFIRLGTHEELFHEQEK